MGLFVLAFFFSQEKIGRHVFCNLIAKCCIMPRTFEPHSHRMKSRPSTIQALNRQSPGAQHLHALAEAQLRSATVRITKARIKVLAALLAANRALSHQEMQDQFTEMDRVTLYRSLDCLTEAGLAHKIAGDDRTFRYSAGTPLAEQSVPSRTNEDTGRHQHGHFKCTRCSRIFCLEKNEAPASLTGADSESAKRQVMLRRQLQNELQKTLGNGFRSHDIELTIKGWCADCGH
jgi:Fur family ferric uptake transcriptional regulator